jgi:serine/threonine protein kinase
MLSGKLPFTGETEAATWKSVVHTDPAPLPQHISPDVKKLVTIMLSKSPDRRPSVDQIVLTKLVTRYVKLLVGYGRLAKNQYEVLKGPVDSKEEEAESKPSMPRKKRAPVKEEGQLKERTKTRERQKEEVKGAVEGKGAGKPEERQGKDASKGSKEEVKGEKKEGGKETIPADVKKEAEIPK